MIIKMMRNPDEFDGKKITISGWVETTRGNKKIAFIELNDGSTIDNLQLVLKIDLVNFDAVDTITQGSSIRVSGVFKSTPNNAQKAELSVESLEILKMADAEYPIQKQAMNLETLREIPHVRHRTKFMRAVMLIRSKLSQNIHWYFQSNDYLNVHSPIITSNDGEGAGEAFSVDSDTWKNFFGNKKATLGVTGQLHAESYAIGFQKVYTFAPTFRAENSNTKKHLAEFWMLEPEVAYFELKDIIYMSDDMLKKVISKTMNELPSEFKYLDEKSEHTLIEKIEKFTKVPLKVLNYNEVIEILNKNTGIFENNDIHFGMDLGTEHERFIAEQWAKSPVAVINYPKDIKAFYMHQNDDNKTVAAFDLLVPGIGELIGGSQREVRYEKLLQRVNELNIPQADLQWYLDLRRFGDSGSAGFGLGFERLVMFCTGVENIRDSIPYPRTVNSLRM